jgi:hypothetical protein
MHETGFDELVREMVASDLEVMRRGASGVANLSSHG